MLCSACRLQARAERFPPWVLEPLGMCFYGAEKDNKTDTVSAVDFPLEEKLKLDV